MDALLVLNVLVPSQVVGLLIGKNGSNLREVSQSTGVFINFQAVDDMPEHNAQRTLSLRGSSRKSILLALSVVLNKLQKPHVVTSGLNSETGLDDEEELASSLNQQLSKWVIPQDMCGVLIGRGGEGIKKINDVSGAWVKVAHVEEFRHSVHERLVYIRGTQEQNIAALHIIKHKVGGRAYIEGEDAPVVARAAVAAAEVLQVPIKSIPFIFGLSSTSSTPRGVFSRECDGFDRSVSYPLDQLGTDEYSSVLSSRTDREVGPEGSVSSERDALPSFTSCIDLYINDCRVYLEPTVEVSCRNALIHFEGELEAQQRAVSVIKQRLSEWTSSQDPGAEMPSRNIMIPGSVVIPNLPQSILAPMNVGTTSTLTLAVDPDSPIGVAIVINANAANLFQLSKHTYAHDLADAVQDLGLSEEMGNQFRSQLITFLESHKAAIQLLPVTPVPLSVKHETRKVSIIAPTVEALLEVLSCIFQLLSHYQVTIMPILPLQGQKMAQPSSVLGINMPASTLEAHATVWAALSGAQSHSQSPAMGGRQYGNYSGYDQGPQQQYQHQHQLPFPSRAGSGLGYQRGAPPGPPYGSVPPSRDRYPASNPRYPDHLLSAMPQHQLPGGPQISGYSYDGAPSRGPSLAPSVPQLPYYIPTNGSHGSANSSQRPAARPSMPQSQMSGPSMAQSYQQQLQSQLLQQQQQHRHLQAQSQSSMGLGRPGSGYSDGLKYDTRQAPARQPLSYPDEYSSMYDDYSDRDSGLGGVGHGLRAPLSSSSSISSLSSSASAPRYAPRDMQYSRY